MFSKPKPSGLDLFSAIIGVPGAGKTELASLARTLVPAGGFALAGTAPVDGVPIGTGEGLVRLYLEWKGHEWVQTKFNAFVVVDEGSIMEDIKNRTGSTLSSVMRTAFTGEMMGASNASKETTRIAKNYCFGIAINLQPEAAKHLLAEDKYGTPQRFLWFNATDPIMPETPPYAAEFQIRLPTESQHIYFDHIILADIRKTLWLRASGKEEAVEIDAHIGWIQCKVAAVLVVWDGRSTVDEEDWRLAKMIVDTSRKVRNNLLEMLRKQKEEEEDSKLAKRVHDKVTLENANKKVIHYAKDLAKKVRDAGRISNSDLRRKMWKPARVFFDDAIQWAEGQRWVEQDGQAGWKPGPNEPD